MRSQRGYSLIEVLIALGFIGVVGAIAVPVFLSSNTMSALWTSAERMGALIRQTRLKAISQNNAYIVRFDCPNEGDLRALVVTGDPTIDAAANRCSLAQEGDSEIIELSTGVTFDPGTATELQVTGRGVFNAVGGAIPLTIQVSYGAANRYLTVSATGQITFSDTEP